MERKILIIDDEKGMRDMLDIYFSRKGYTTITEKSFRGAIKKLEELKDISVVITDLILPDGDGIDIIKFVKEKSPTTQVIVITAYGTTQMAVKAMKLGAYDFIEKPLNIEELGLLVERAEEKKQILDQNIILKSKVESQFKFEDIIARSSCMRKIVEMVKVVSATSTNVLITGESGTGKEVIARAIHNLSPRRDKRFVPINCGAIPEELIESELFGHEKGAFTGAVKETPGLFKVADGGTIFLDEIAELPLNMQVKLLRVLQDKTIRPVGAREELKVDVRVIAATNKNLEEEVAKGRFRSDLYYRLNIIHIELPPLRERREDIPYFIDYFVKLYSSLNNKRVKGLSDEAINFLMNYDFPGNVRELENMIERGVTLCKGDIIELEDILGEKKTQLLYNSREEVELKEGFNLDHYLDSIEHMLLLKALKKSKGNKTKAAELLGISFRSFRYRLKKHGLDNEQ